jgi:hypothetical protein
MFLVTIQGKGVVGPFASFESLILYFGTESKYTVKIEHPINPDCEILATWENDKSLWKD